jgi:hypothetical protein
MYQSHIINTLPKKISFISLPCLVAVYSVTHSDCVVSKDCMKMNNEFKSVGKIEVGLFPWNVPRRNGETHERSQDSRRPERDPNPKLPNSSYHCYYSDIR